MGYRVLADENVERATISYLRKFDHEIEWIGDVDELCLGAGDTAIADYASKHDRLIPYSWPPSYMNIRSMLSPSRVQ